MNAVANTEGLRQLGELALALALSSIIGVEREIRQKSAGLRTHALVGVGAALFVLVSKYAFSDVTIPKLVVLDPSRVAAQIVTGIGFIGAGLIFVRRDSVVGLTTAAAVWVTAAVGAAAGGGLPVLAAVGTAAYLVITVGFLPLGRLLPSGASPSEVRVRYVDGRGVLRDVLAQVTEHGFTVSHLTTRPHPQTAAGSGDAASTLVEVTLRVVGRRPASEMAMALTEIPGVDGVHTEAEVDTG